MAEEQEASSTRSDAEADENALITVLDAIAVALSAPDGEATSPGSIRELTGFATHILAETLGGSAVLWLKDDSGRLELFASADQDPTTDNLLLRALKGARPLAGGGLVGRVLDAGGPLEASQTTWRELLEWDQAGLSRAPRRARGARARSWHRSGRAPKSSERCSSRSAPKRGPSGLERTVLQDVADQIGLARAYVSQVSARANAESLVLEREARLRSNAGRQAALADLGRWALVGLAFPNLVEDAVSLLAEQLEVDFVHVFEAMADTRS